VAMATEMEVNVAGINIEILKLTDTNVYCVCVYRYMVALEDTINVALCGLFLLLLAALCFISFSAVTVKYSLLL
jgi:hypothetical protein